MKASPDFDMYEQLCTFDVQVKRNEYKYKKIIGL